MSRPLYTPVTVMDPTGVPAYRTLMNIGTAQEIRPAGTGCRVVFGDATYLVKEGAEQLEEILKRARALYGSLSKHDGEPA